MKRAALLVIGDEILNGRVKDENSFVFANLMFESGVSVERILVIPDHIPTISRSVIKLAKKYDYLCTSGGVGPTHDDLTLDAVGQAFSRPLVEHKQALEHFRAAQKKAGRGEIVSDAQRKMLAFPSPCQVYFLDPLWLPLVKVENVYIFPGVPFLFQKLLSGMAHMFEGERFFIEEIYTDLTETKIAATLKDYQEKNHGINIGSYPQMPGHACRVMVTVKGNDEILVNKITNELLPKINGRKRESLI